MSGLLEFFTHLFDTSDFPARWSCGRWSSAHGWLHIASDSLIFGAYMAIPASLAVVATRRRDLPLRPIFWLFVAFIMSCGLTHLVEAILFYQPVYRFSGVMKAATALVSWATVLALVRVLPTALTLPGIQATNEMLRAEIARRTIVETELEKARQDLEQRTSQLVLREHRMRSALEAAHVGAIRWEVDTGRIIWELGLRERLHRLEFGSTELHEWSSLLGDVGAADLRALALGAERSDGSIDFAGEMRDGGRTVHVRMAARLDPKVTGQPRTMTGMLRFLTG